MQKSTVVPGALRPPMPLAALSDPEARDTDPTFTGDRREVYFMSDRRGTKDLFRSRRSSPNLPWPAPEHLTALSTDDFQEENPHVAEDGRTLWFYTDRDRSQGTIWRATRRSERDAWSTPVAVPELGGGEQSSDVAVGVDETERLAVLASKPPGASSYDLFLYGRERTDEPFADPTFLVELSAEDADDFDGVLMDGGLHLAFHSNRAGNEDIFLASRSATTVAFDPPAPVLELNTEAAESAPAFSTALDYVMFSSDREGTQDLFETTRAP